MKYRDPNASWYVPPDEVNPCFPLKNFLRDNSAYSQNIHLFLDPHILFPPLLECLCFLLSFPPDTTFPRCFTPTLSAFLTPPSALWFK